MRDQTKGLYNKYQVINRETGLEAEGECFVLRPDRDPAAVPALLRYAEATRNQALAADIWDWLHKIAPAVVDGEPYEGYPLLDGSMLLSSPGDRVLALCSGPGGLPITTDPESVIDDVLMAYGASLLQLKHLKTAGERNEAEASMWEERYSDMAIEYERLNSSAGETLDLLKETAQSLREAQQTISKIRSAAISRDALLKELDRLARDKWIEYDTAKNAVAKDCAKEAIDLIDHLIPIVRKQPTIDLEKLKHLGKW